MRFPVLGRIGSFLLFNFYSGDLLWRYKPPSFDILAEIFPTLQINQIIFIMISIALIKDEEVRKKEEFCGIKCCISFNEAFIFFGIFYSIMCQNRPDYSRVLYLVVLMNNIIRLANLTSLTPKIWLHKSRGPTSDMSRSTSPKFSREFLLWLSTCYGVQVKSINNWRLRRIEE